MVNFTILTGGYTSYILTHVFNTKTASLSLVANTTTGSNPSWLALNPIRPNVFYATNEAVEGDGALQSFHLYQNGTFSLIDTISSGGNGPAYAAAFKTGEVAVTNYFGANGRIIPTNKAGAKFAQNAPVISFPAPDNGTANPHAAAFYKNEVFIPDLGGDKIWRLGKQYGGNWNIHGFIQHPKGVGPRHIAIKDDYLYVIHETASTVTVQKIPSDPTANSDILGNVTVKPTNGPADADWRAAEIFIPPTSLEFKTPYIYATQRNIANRSPSGDHDPRGDPIFILEHVGKGTKNESLQIVAQVDTGLEELRGVWYGSNQFKGGDKYIVATGGQSGGIVIYERVDGGRGLKEVVRDNKLEPRTSVLVL